MGFLKDPNGKGGPAGRPENLLAGSLGVGDPAGGQAAWIRSPKRLQIEEKKLNNQNLTRT